MIGKTISACPMNKRGAQKNLLSELNIRPIQPPRSLSAVTPRRSTSWWARGRCYWLERELRA